MEEKIIQEDPKQPNSSKELQEKFKTLEQDYRSFTQSSSRFKPLKKISGRRTDCCSIQHQLRLFDSSPRHLMSSLQTRKRRGVRSSPFSSPVTVTVSGEVWRMRENELAKEEMRRERNRAIESGELKGRRLFVSESEIDFDDETDENEERGRDLGFREKELKGVRLFDDEDQSICGSISGEFDQKEAREGEGGQGKLCFRGSCVCLERETGGERKLDVENGGYIYRVIRLGFVKLCFVVVFVAFVLGIFLGGFDEFGGDEEKVVLVPT